MINAPTLSDIRAAAELLFPHIIQTPLVCLGPGRARENTFLKLENLQPAGSFKVRPVGNAVLSADIEKLPHGVYTASSGNAGLSLAWAAQKMGVPATVYAPASAPSGKLEAIRDMGARLELLTDEQWWQIILHGQHAADAGRYIDAVRDSAALAGNGTIGLEIVAQCPDVDTVIVPFGGGGVACGVAAAVRAVKPGVRVLVAECTTAAPLTAAFAAGRPVGIDVQPSFISGAGAPAVLAEMWPMLRELVDGTVTCSLSAVRSAIRYLFTQNRVVAEGAGAIPVAASLSRSEPAERTVCVVTGGNIDAQVMADILLSAER